IRAYLAVAAVLAILLGDLVRQPFVHGTWADHLEPVAIWDPLGYGLEESSQVFETVRFADVARASATAGPDARVVADLLGRLRGRRPPAPGRSAASTRRIPGPAGHARRQCARPRPPDRVFRIPPRSSGRCRGRLGPAYGC